MKKRLRLTGLAISLWSISIGQVEKDISSKINKVTVFTKSAQIEREASVSLQEGQMILRLKLRKKN